MQLLLLMLMPGDLQCLRCPVILMQAVSVFAYLSIQQSISTFHQTGYQSVYFLCFDVSCMPGYLLISASAYISTCLDCLMPVFISVTAPLHCTVQLISVANVCESSALKVTSCNSLDVNVHIVNICWECSSQKSKALILFCFSWSWASRFITKDIHERFWCDCNETI